MADEPKPLTPQSNRELQQLWFAVLKREWSSLVVVPSHPGSSGLNIARELASIASIHRGTEVKLINAESAELRGTSRLIVEMTSVVRAGQMCIVAVDSVVENQAGIPLALAADAALLLVTLNETELASARKTLELVGPSRFVGSVVVRPTA